MRRRSAQIGEILALYTRRSDSLAAVAGGPVLAAPVTVERGDAAIPDSLWERWQLPAGVGPVPLYDLEGLLGQGVCQRILRQCVGAGTHRSGGDTLVVYVHRRTPPCAP